MVAIVVLKGREGGAEAVICEPTHSRYAEEKKKKKKITYEKSGKK